MTEPIRCAWCLSDPLYIQYHDEQWGVPVHEDRKLFEFLVLEGAQAGLSWLTVLKKRQGYQKAFRDFNVHTLAKLGEKDVQKLLLNADIIRHQGKIRSVITNAQAFIQVQAEYGSFDAYGWSFVGGQPIVHALRRLEDMPSMSKESEAFSKDLKQRGFRFVGPTIMYAYMQAVGMVNDHLVSCVRFQASLV